MILSFFTAVSAATPSKAYKISEPSPTPQGNIKFNGGNVMANGVNIYGIYYGNHADSTKQLITKFVNNLGSSDWWTIVETYSGDNGQINNQVAYKGTYNDNYSLGKNLASGSLNRIIDNAVKAASWPKDPNGIYVVFVASDVSEKSSNGGFCTDYCGYHGTTSSGLISTMVGDPTRCPGTLPPPGATKGTAGCMNRYSRNQTDPAYSVNKNAAADSMISVLAHEIAEAASDFDNAWRDGSGEENGDKCAAYFLNVQGVGASDPYDGAYNVQFADGTKYLIQSMWDAKRQGCYLGSGAQPKPTTTAKATPTPTGTTCAHDKCVTGSVLKSSCDPCVAKIIARDSYCGSTQWDSTCVQEVASVCSLSCNGASKHTGPLIAKPDTFHPSCMQNYNRKPLCRDCKKSNKKKHGGEFEDASEVVFMTSDFESGRFFVDEEIEDDDDHDQLTFSESDPEVYEEPDTSDGEGDEIMLEIVQERLVQGWSSSSDDESELEELFTPEMVPVPAPVPQKLELDNDIEELLQVETVEPMEPIDLQKEEKPLSFDIKKTQIVNGEIVSTTKSIKWQPGQQTPAPPKKKNPPKKQPQKTPVANNQWLAMAALNMSNQKPKPTPPKTPLNLTSVASAAAALMANPAALKALTELRKTQLSKIQKEKKKVYCLNLGATTAGYHKDT
ncbi:phosphate-induced protein 1 conserved region-domain-containing protein [Gorgonomyces haynaldii]|nr:phosphate-induced protein 1 conserved region-domain-containing protein [Gorgonomyces haynaldii]